MFETFVVQPILNLLILLYAIIPGHNFGVALILFTVLVRLAIHPLVRKQLHHNRAMRELQPEIDAIKKASKGDKQKVAELTMELYKEREISPFSSIGTLIVQVIILIGLYTGLRHVASDPGIILNNAYDWLKNLGALKDLAVDINRFDFTLVGVVDLSRTVSSPAGFYFPAFLLVVGSAVSQYFMGKQTLPEDKTSRSLKRIIKDSRSGGEKAGQAEVQNISSQFLKYIIPLLIFLLTYGLASAVALYWFASGVVGYFQQKHILGQDESELINQKSGKKTKS